MRRFRRRLHRIPLKKKIWIVFSIFFILIIFIDFQLRPLLKSVVASQARMISISIINDIVIDELSRLDVDYSAFVKIERDQNGKVLAINTDIKKVNMLKSEIATKVQAKLSSVGTKTIWIAIGTLTGTEVLNGRGPKVPLKINMSGSILADLNSTFVSAGINQTKHQIYLDISTKIFAIVPGYPVSTGVETNVAIAETIIVGEVPNVFASLDGKNPQILGRVDDMVEADKEKKK